MPSDRAFGGFGDGGKTVLRDRCILSCRFPVSGSCSSINANRGDTDDRVMMMMTMVTMS